MKVLHLNANWTMGGAHIACKRLHDALIREGVDSHVLCQVTEGVEDRVHLIPTRCPCFIRRVRKRLVYELKRRQYDSSAYFLSLNYLRNHLVDTVKKLRPDVVHLHWVGGDFLRIEDLPRINVPLVWTLHDMWPFCGAEHVSFHDARWREGYTRLNRPEEARGPDLNRWVWGRKRKAWHGTTIHTIGVSSWIDRCLRESRLFTEIKGLRRVIPNGLDENVFRPDGEEDNANDRRRSRKVRLAFGAVKQLNPIKGGEFLGPALKNLADAGLDLEVITFGAGESEFLEGVTVRNRGEIADAQELANLYRSVDLMVVPSRIESFGQTAAEAMACGTPVVCFDTSGLRDIVEHEKTGYLARCYEPDDLANGIRWCVETPERLSFLKLQARERAVRLFRIGDVAHRTIEFYKEILQQER